MDHINRITARAGAVSLSMVLFVLGGSSLAYATTPAPTGAEGAITDNFGSLVGLVVGVLAAALFGITLAVLGIRMGIKWLKRGAST